MKRKTKQTLLALTLIVGGVALFVLSASLHQKMNEPPAPTQTPQQAMSAAPVLTPAPNPTPEPTPKPAPLPTTAPLPGTGLTRERKTPARRSLKNCLPGDSPLNTPMGILLRSRRS